ncbi:oxoglutarate dehydrogenase (succinyl-transferring), E1 component [Kwoniella shivajii]|uniref:Oxoglutarate dehydrogenase (Succinyl-transferring), E1 component n=1 Tax=Kwoniella shivajii TaxID=564305 RepID=A0ABZ1CUX2_9TREE|nr:oxoglutarate dehydrogenase (succinyl-transferring), E1 component [Kwoniella shivajii]
MLTRILKTHHALPRAVSRGCPRQYHDDSTFGYRVPQKYELPDYTQKELDNRNANAPLLRYVESVRRHGHRAAQIDPLDLMDRDPVGALDPLRYGLEALQSYPLQGILHLPPSPEPTTPPSTVGPERSETGEGSKVSVALDKIKEHLMSVYVDKIGFEYMHCPEKNERLWFSHHVETETSSFPLPLDDKRRKRIWELLMRSEELDKFLAKKFPNLKRYGCEGAESMLPALSSLFEVSAEAGISSIVLSLPHRGRLSLLCDPDLMAFPPKALFAKIKGKPEFDPATAPGATGDVISHLSATRQIPFDTGKRVKVKVLQNPSHLEAVNPVALGVTRAKQMELLKSSPRECQLGDKVMCVQLHGDAAFAGQGVVAESLGLSGLPHFGSGGTVHIIVNNNIGYTTPASLARSSIYSSDIAKMIGCPILHVNGDHPESVTRAVDIAFRYRQMFRKDVIIDLICYRRWGHNELDEPAYTQPLMYNKIRGRKSVPELYESRLVEQQLLTYEAASSTRRDHVNHLEEHFNQVESYKPRSEMLEGKWKNYVWPAGSEADHDPDTGVKEEELLDVAQASVTLPDSFNIHPRLRRHISSRLKSLDAKVDFATAEAMAFGTLMKEGLDVRISGQDVGRGTFSQRHAMFVDQQTESCHIPLNEGLSGATGKLELANSSLSEMAVLGFEVGLSWSDPQLLPIWEAQFGDFMNGAQSMIDTFIVGAEAKWLKQSGIVIMLPHGYDGAGPEHSSCKVERFLQLSNDTRTTNTYGDINLTVVNPSTPAQMFHILRRQMKRNYRKPLIVASPKGLLRSPLAASSLSEMTPGNTFQPIIEGPTNSSADRVVLCTGKHYYTLLEHVTKTDKMSSVNMVRVEELSPFPYSELENTLSKYKNKEIVWAQEEPSNQGAWSYVKPRLEGILEKVGYEGTIRYAGRKVGATTAVAVGEWHKREVEEIVKAALE